MQYVRWQLVNKIGAELSINKDELYAPKYLSVIAEVSQGADVTGENVTLIGKTTDDKAITCAGVSITIDEVISAF